MEQQEEEGLDRARLVHAVVAIEDIASFLEIDCLLWNQRER
jgi:hypothetical protein